ncbi:MAG: amino acid ABC transporter substrate-binding protein [Pseudomonadota bacterium]|nr:MAG: amino acid ABC transporter substrate-binding protein [Pseudomonadota bacterium]
MNRFILLLGACMLLLSTTIATAAELKVATSTWPPYVDKNLEKNGLAVHIAMTALERAGHTPVLKIESWPRTLQGVNVGVYDVIAAAWYSDERAQAFTFSKPYLVNQIKFIKRKGAPIQFNSLADLKGRTIGIVQNYAYGAEFDQASGLIKIATNHVIQNLLRLSQGQIDLTLDDERVLHHELKQYMSQTADQFEILPKPLSENGLHIAVSKKNPAHKEIAAAFEKAIDKMKADGTYKAIIDLHD